MKKTLQAARFLGLVALGLAALAPASRAQSYGPNEQTLTVGAEAFRGAEGGAASIDDAGYLEDPVAGAYSYYLAPLPLPNGAEITNLCMYVNDSDPGDFEWVNVYLRAVKLVPLGGAPYVLDIPGSLVSSQNGGDIGYGYYCTAPFDYVLRSPVDLDGDGTAENVAYYVAAYVPHANQNTIGFGGVRITWKRRVSDPPPAPTFGDVPETDFGFVYVEALAASGITGGCGGGNYCPNANLTRRQMAIFLAKALGLHWVD
jgi:S-layer homology domain